MRGFARGMVGAAAAMLAAGCSGDGMGGGGISPTGPLFVGNTATVTVSCPAQMEQGQSSTCNAYGYDSNSTFTNSNESSWSSSNTSVATVSSSGAISAVGVGTATIYAVIDGITGSTGVSVVSPPPLSASISGPTVVPPNSQCYWWANVSGGVPAYNYAWRGGVNGVVSGSEYTATTPGSGTFDVKLGVTDAASGSVSTYVTVTVSSSALPCPY